MINSDKKNLYDHKNKEGGLHKRTFLISSEKLVREILEKHHTSLQCNGIKKFIPLRSSVNFKYVNWVSDVRYLGQLTWHGSSVPHEKYKQIAQLQVNMSALLALSLT